MTNKTDCIDKAGKEIRDVSMQLVSAVDEASEGTRAFAPEEKEGANMAFHIALPAFSAFIADMGKDAYDECMTPEPGAIPNNPPTNDERQK